MLLYKYRGDFERDLESLKKNLFYAPTFDKLNDPSETLINTDPFKKQAKLIGSFFGKLKTEQFLAMEKAQNNLFNVRKNSIGIYSLSKTFNDELLWAHYSDCHKGFCIEYDSEKLLNINSSFKTYSFPFIYSKKPPEYAVKDINKTKSIDVIQKLAGFKSVKWKYEQEFRIVTDYYGNHPYEYDSVKSIYFGLKMLDSEKETMMKILKGRRIQFYQIIQKSNSYEFDRIKLNDTEMEEITYLKEFPTEVTGTKPIKFNILEKKYYREGNANIEIEIEKKINKDVITLITDFFKNELFFEAKRVSVIYFLKDQKK